MSKLGAPSLDSQADCLLGTDGSPTPCLAPLGGLPNPRPRAYLFLSFFQNHTSLNGASNNRAAGFEAELFLPFVFSPIRLRLAGSLNGEPDGRSYACFVHYGG